MRARDVRVELQRFADAKKAKTLQLFFKTGPGQYGEGDIFLGVIVPNSRLVAKKFTKLPLTEVKALLYSIIHEERLVALLILVEKYIRALPKEKQEIAKFYLDNLRQVNSWDLVDLTAPVILGTQLMHKSKRPLFRLARSDNVWERRVAIIATLQFIRCNDFSVTLDIAEILLADDHDLIHKAVGWMLREVGKRNVVKEEAFLDMHYKVMPRTMLRYAIERFSDGKKRHYMKRQYSR
jgi:3-methyladenine DNA glycosylase AlkD